MHPTHRLLSEKPLVVPRGRGKPRPLWPAAWAATRANRHWAPLLVVLLLLGGRPLAAQPSPAWERYEFTQVHMGTEFKLVFYAPDERAANRASEAAFARIAALDARFSDYRPDSELSQLSDTAGSGRAVPVSDELWSILSTSQDFAHRTGGAFDVTCGQVVRQWRRARRQKTLPSDRQIESARQTVGYADLVLDPAAHSATLHRPGTRLDLGGIAQGYAADQALSVLAASGCPQALVDASGDVALGQPPPGQAHWLVALSQFDAARPPDGSGDFAPLPPAESLQLARQAVSTSGDLYQHVVLGGRRFSHIVDPRSGWALEHSPLVTVVAPDAVTADALATAVSVLDWEACLRLAANFPGTELLRWELDGEQVIRRATPGWAALRGAEK